MPDVPSRAHRRKVSSKDLETLRSIVGNDHLLSDREQVINYGSDATESLVFPPQVVVRPGDSRQVAAVVAWAHARRIPVTPQGARTGLSGGALPVFGGVALSLERLDRIRRLDVEDMVAEVEAGVVTSTLQKAATERGLYYPPDPASRESCQIGGNIAEDAAGPHSCKYGTTRRYVLGLEAVMADGTLIKTGSGNRKDVTGYNLTQILVGSEGTLAVVTAATLRLVSQPRARLVLGLGFETLERGARAVTEIFAAGLEPAACELMESRALELVGRRLELPRTLRGAGAFVLLELDGDAEDGLLLQAEQLAALFAPIEPSIALDARDRRRLWRIRSEIGVAVKEHSSYKEVDAVVPRSELVNLVSAARAAAAAAGLDCVCYGHAGDGNLHVNLLQGELEAEDWQRRRDAAETELIDAVIALGGAVSGEHGIGWTQRRHLPRALDPGALAVMARLKKSLDPRGILNPGKILP